MLDRIRLFIAGSLCLLAEMIAPEYFEEPSDG